MKSNKLFIGLLATSLTINIVTFFTGSEETLTTDSSNENAPIFDNVNTSLFSEQEFSDEAEKTGSSENNETEQLQALKKKIAILVKQNKAFQLQVNEANEKQDDIITALNTIVSKIDVQLLMPSTSSSDFQSSNYNLDFNSISRDVVKQCMNLAADTSSTIRQQQRQTREQLLLNEDVDDVWSNDIESKIESVLSDPQLRDSELISLNCRTTICQVKIQHNSAAAKKLFEAPFFSRFQQSVSQYDESFDEVTNQSTGVFYLTRNNEN